MTCTVPTCPLPAHAHGFCHGHLSRVRRHGDPMPSLPLGSYSTRPQTREPLECLCDEPRPDAVGECQNHGCHRGVMPDRMPDLDHRPLTGVKLPRFPTPRRPTWT